MNAKIPASSVTNTETGAGSTKHAALKPRHENPSGLPDIDEAPGSDIVIYDGQCNFCRSQVQKLRWLAGGRLAFVSLHDHRVAARFPDLTRDQLMEQMYVVTASGQRLAGATGLRYLSRQLPCLWIIAPLLHIPYSLPFWQMLYRIVARQRYRLAGKTTDCDGHQCRSHFD